MGDPAPVTVLLQRFARGDQSALDQVLPIVYSELRRLAAGYLRNERPNHTLQPTALINEAYARLVGQSHPDFESRAHFVGVAAQIMRQILVDHARSRNAQKRGGDLEKLQLNVSIDAVADRPWAIIALDDALTQLARMDPTKSRLVEMRFFGGFTAEESAELLQISVSTVRRELRVAQAWLQREIDRAGAKSDAPFTP
jgi:RNA polymerase sigma factor (TIGR02999 family)